ncbi:hypothetical protein BVI2075_390032 [Burkholderia vietnamiensis]|nr:hypothetical protein BVI2075_390032 [Burkholderia vietnamiensis]
MLAARFTRFTRSARVRPAPRPPPHRRRPARAARKRLFYRTISQRAAAPQRVFCAKSAKIPGFSLSRRGRVRARWRPTPQCPSSARKTSIA